jgi:hypothetical protein
MTRMPFMQCVIWRTS